MLRKYYGNKFIGECPTRLSLREYWNGHREGSTAMIVRETITAKNCGKTTNNAFISEELFVSGSGKQAQAPEM